MDIVAKQCCGKAIFMIVHLVGTYVLTTAPVYAGLIWLLARLARANGPSWLERSHSEEPKDRA